MPVVQQFYVASKNRGDSRGSAGDVSGQAQIVQAEQMWWKPTSATGPRERGRGGQRGRGWARGGDRGRRGGSRGAPRGGAGWRGRGGTNGTGAPSGRGRGSNNGELAHLDDDDAQQDAQQDAKTAVLPQHLFRMPRTWVNPELPFLRPNCSELLDRLREHTQNANLRSEEGEENGLWEEQQQRSGFRRDPVVLSVEEQQWADEEKKLNEEAREKARTEAFKKNPETIPLSILVRVVEELDNQIRIRGNTIDGISCSVLVKDFHPYFFVAMPDSWDESHVPIFEAALKTRALEIQAECKSTGARVPNGLLPAPTCAFDQGKSAFRWLPKKLCAIKITCNSPAAWRFYCDLLTDGKEAEYQQEVEELFKKRDAEEAAKKAAKKAQTVASRLGHRDIAQPQVDVWSYKNENKRFKAPPSIVEAEAGSDRDDDSDLGEDDDGDDDDDDAEGALYNEGQGIARYRASVLAGGRARSNEPGANDADIAEETVPAEDQPSTFNRHARKHQWNGVEVKDAPLPYDEETGDYSYRFEVHNNGWKMDVLFLALTDQYRQGWLNVLDPRLIEDDEQQRKTTTQIEVECSVKDLKADKERTDRDHSFGWSYDIECVPAKDPQMFPNASNLGDMINIITVQIDQPGSAVPQPPIRVGFCVGTAIPSMLPHMNFILLFATEAELLVAYRNFLVEKVDPDCIEGYNSVAFDTVYYLDRAAVLGLDECSYLSDLKHKQCTVRNVVRQAKQFGKEVFRMTDIPGRMQLDVMRIVPKMYKLDQYTLKFVAKNIKKKDEPRAALRQRLYRLATDPKVPYIDPKDFVNEEPPDPIEDPVAEGIDNDAFWHKEAQQQLERIKNWKQTVTQTDYDRWQKELTAGKMDVPPHKLRPYLLAGPRSRTLALQYCDRDTAVTHKIAADNILQQSAEAMSKLTNTSIDDLLTKGEQLKVWNKYCRIAPVHGWHLNRFYLRQLMPPIRLLERFKGGKVQEPKIALYIDEPVATLDFNSLYPSVGIRNNLCTASLVDRCMLGEKLPEMVTLARNMGFEVLEVKLPTNELLFFHQSCETILPALQRELLNERKATRKKQKKHPKGSVVWAALECEQLAKKLVANCTFGFAGAPRGFAGCPLVAAAITAIGRSYITRTGEMVKAPPFSYDLIYGDTDSVMIRLHHLELDEKDKTGDKEKDFIKMMIKQQEVATIASKAASAMFQDPTKPHLDGVINLDMEKLYFPYLLLGAKNYAGIKYEGDDLSDPKNEPKLDMKGMAAVRRSACPLVRRLCTDMLSSLLFFKDRILALTLLQKALDQLLNNQMPLAVLTRTAKLAGQYASDKKLPAHAVVAEKLRKAGAPEAPAIGSRVQFVYALNGESEKNQSLRAEHPRMLTEQKLQVDLAYYLNKQIHNPIVTFLEWWVRKPQVLFEDARARVYQDTTQLAGGFKGLIKGMVEREEEEKKKGPPTPPPMGGWWRRDFQYEDEPTWMDDGSDDSGLDDASHNTMQELEDWKLRHEAEREHARCSTPPPSCSGDMEDDVVDLNELPVVVAVPVAEPKQDVNKKRKKTGSTVVPLAAGQRSLDFFLTAFSQKTKASAASASAASEREEARQTALLAAKRQRRLDMEFPPLAPVPAIDLNCYVPTIMSSSSSSSSSSSASHTTIDDVRVSATSGATATPRSATATATTTTAIIVLDTNGLPTTTHHFHRNHTALEQPTSAEVLRRLKAQSKGKKKRGFGSAPSTTLTMNRFFHTDSNPIHRRNRPVSIVPPL